MVTRATTSEVLDELEAPGERVSDEDLALVERLWRSGTSATAVSPSTRADLPLLQRFLTTGDDTVLVPLLRRHRVATWRLAAVVTLDVDAAAEAVEAAWRDVVEGDRDVLDGGAGVRAWLFAITRRHAAGAPGTALVSGAPRSPFDRTGDVGLVASSFALLDEAARTAVWLHAVEGLDDADIAHVLGCGRLEAHELTDDAMAELRVAAAHGQLGDAGARCQPTVRSFLPYLDGDLDDDGVADLVVHLARCRRCAARLDALEAPGLTLVDRVLVPPAALTARLAALAEPASVA